jgi:Zn-dependent metalloprotease
VRVETFFKDHARELNLGPDDDFKPGVPQKGLSGFSSTRFQHIYRGLPVFGAEYVVTQTPAGDVSSGMGRIVAGLSLGASPTVSATNALAIAKDKLAKQLGFPAPSTFEVERQTLGYGAPRSVAFTDVSAYRLIYRIILASNSQGFHHQIDVDALTGDIAEIVSLSVH